MTVNVPSNARSHMPMASENGTPNPSKPIAVKAMIKRSVRSAIPPEHWIPSDSAFART